MFVLTLNMTKNFCGDHNVHRCKEVIGLEVLFGLMILDVCHALGRHSRSLRKAVITGSRIFTLFTHIQLLFYPGSSL